MQRNAKSVRVLPLRHLQCRTLDEENSRHLKLST